MERRSVQWTPRCWRWNSNTLVTWCGELTHLKRPRCWERLRARGEGDNRGWDGRMASPTQWTWVWVDFGSLWWTGRPGVLRFMGSERVGHAWVTELNWTELMRVKKFVSHDWFSFVILFWTEQLISPWVHVRLTWKMMPLFVENMNLIVLNLFFFFNQPQNKRFIKQLA